MKVFHVIIQSRPDIKDIYVSIHLELKLVLSMELHWLWYNGNELYLILNEIREGSLFKMAAIKKTKPLLYSGPECNFCIIRTNSFKL